MEPNTVAEVARVSQDISAALHLLGLMITGSTLIGGTAVVWAFKKFVNHIISRDERWAVLIVENTKVTRDLKGVIASCPSNGKFSYIENKLEAIHDDVEKLVERQAVP